MNQQAKGAPADNIAGVSVRANLIRLFKYLKPYWQKQLFAFMFLSLGTGSSLIVPLLVKRIIDVALPDGERQLLLKLVFAMAGFHLFYMLCMFITDYLFLRVSNGIVIDLRRDLNDKLIRLSMDYFGKTKAGQIMSRVMGDVDSVQTLTTNAFLMLLTDSMAVILMLAFMLYLSWQMTMISAGIFVVLALINKVFNRRLVVSARESRSTYARISEDLQEEIAGIREIKAFTFENSMRRTFLKTLMQYYRANFRIGILGSVSRQLSMLIISMGPVIVYGYGGLGVMGGEFTLGMLVAFIVYLGRMYTSVQRLTFLNVQAQSAMGAVERIFDLLDTKPSVYDGDETVQAADIKGDVLLDNVAFKYVKDDGSDILRGFNLHLRPGEKVALVGASGAGKTTIVNLICRFYDVQDGSVFMDGIDVRKMKISDLRRRIGLVPQDTFLFHASIEENLKLGKPDATREEIERAVAMAYADEFIFKLTDGFDSIVGERGMRLSGGQKQRLSIARVLLKNPQIVIFDEATSSLDSESERLVKNSMDRLREGRTTLIVSHRLSTVVDADRIIVLDKGVIVEEGTHQSLMEAGGTYLKLYEQQMSEP